MTNMQCLVCLESYFSLNMKTQDSKKRQPTLMSEAPAAACEVGNDCTGASDLQRPLIWPVHCWLQSLWEPSFGVVDCRECSEYGFWGVASLVLSGSYLPNKMAGKVQIIWENTQGRWRLPFWTNNHEKFLYAFIRPIQGRLALWPFLYILLSFVPPC